MTERLGQLDLVFVVDNTGSMGPYIEQVKMKILEIIKTIKKEELCHKLRIGLVSYRDHMPEDDSFVTQKFELTSDTPKIEDNVVKMRARGGGDGPEAVCDALNAANRMEFLLDAAKVVVLVGDAPPHGVEPSGDNFPKGCPQGFFWKTESENAFSKGIVIHTVGCFPEIANYQKAVETYEEIAKKTEGKFFPLEKAELLVKIITGIAIEEIDKIAIQQSILETLGVKMEDIDEEDITPERIAELSKSIRAKGVTKRSVAHYAPSAAPSGAGEEVLVEEAEIEEDDVREALRQLKRKAGK
jgi:Mg-chelatase subunit ChlD